MVPDNSGDESGPLAGSSEDFLERLEAGDYDFVDLGTCEGNGFVIAARQGGKRGLGFDTEPQHVARGRENGLDVACLDVCTLKAERPVVDFAICSHILEHLASLDHVEGVLRVLSSLCRDYILIFGPCFDEEDYLAERGVKLLHSLMPDHLCRFRTIDLVSVLDKLRLRNYQIAVLDRVSDTDNQWIHVEDEPVPWDGLWTYDPAKHKPKPSVAFDRDVFINVVCVVSLRPGIDADAILRNFVYDLDKVVHRSSWGFDDGGRSAPLTSTSLDLP